MMEPFEAYKQYLAIKSHFTSKTYDYFKYRGKVRATFDSFGKNNGKYFFGKLGRKYKDQFPEFVATCYAYGHPLKWIGDGDGEECEEIWTRHEKTMQSLTRTFESDIMDIMTVMQNNNITFKDMLRSINGQLPMIEKMRTQELTTMETCVIINSLTQYTDKVECSNPLWDDSKRLIGKYQGFVKFDKIKFAKLLKSKLV